MSCFLNTSPHCSSSTMSLWHVSCSKLPFVKYDWWYSTLHTTIVIHNEIIPYSSISYNPSFDCSKKCYFRNHLLGLLFYAFSTPYCPLCFTTLPRNLLTIFLPSSKTWLLSILVYIWSNLYLKDGFYDSLLVGMK